jgi:radical SAM-linked protein
MAAQPESSPLTGRPDSGPPARWRVALHLAVAGDVRFLSHHDELRMLERAFVRARWPLAYTGGFNPRPRLVLPLPRSVGMAADCHLVLVDLVEPRPSEELTASLTPQLPAGYRLLGLLAPAPARVPHPRTIHCEVEVDAADAERLPARIEELFARDTLVVQRGYGPGRASRAIDIRPYLERIQLTGRRLGLRLRYRDQRTARPSEIINELGLAADAYNHRVRRAAVQWDTELCGPETGPLARERKCCFDYQEDDPKEDRRGA